MRVAVGLDEVGRGSWAGPLVAGAVILAKPIAGLKDSKRLTKKQRQKLDQAIRQQALAFGLGWVTPRQIDQLGLTKSITIAMEAAINQIKVSYHQLLIDGSFNFLSHLPNSKPMTGGDALEPCISAASIVAKVARDNFMYEIATKYPSYGFENHVGYGTKAHLAAIKKYGVCDVHRKSFRPVSQQKAVA